MAFIEYNSDNFVKHKKSPLSVREIKFINKYIETGDEELAYKVAGYKGKSLVAGAKRVMSKPTVRAEIEQRKEALRASSIATGTEVMEYFSRVMRGQEKDQFGLDAPLAERTKAAQELIKRTFDLEYKEKQIEELEQDAQINITIDWGV